MPTTTSPALRTGSFSGRSQPVLEAGTALLRPWTPVDVPAVVAAYEDPAIQRWHARTMSRAEAEAWVGHWAGRWAQESGGGWAVEVDGQAAGQVSLRRIDLHEACVELSYWMLPAVRGRGVATAALTALTQWAFDLGVHRAQLDHSTRNAASCRVATKAGYAAEGTAVQRGLHADGWHDMHLHARVSAAAARER
ncbi:RimJ/RimL family protein N-acetyltransferase [Kineococcus xinjiangensis]|uniref:RimJ/RimL family protein N-acetyltransferase n=1 Tax=Kineococcus xinjiangensis TaxID=512762 RepID=A0A2S6IU89_9ACTN|nr:GNAT family N-acetyltransferase [Kineococcus xinjiangensis]PPK97740.1 RimJ/RimL family protein N-acetyltransferase [Kineococcus xinjiangensis]